jgi:hypothetical protein
VIGFYLVSEKRLNGKWRFFQRLWLGTIVTYFRNPSKKLSRSNQRFRFTWDRTKTENRRYNHPLTKGRTSDRFESVGAVGIVVSNALSRCYLLQKPQVKS